MNIVLWFLAGAVSAVLAVGAFYLLRRWRHQRRYGLPIAHEELLVKYGRQMAGLLEREALGRLLAADVPQALQVARATVLFSEGHDLAATGDRLCRKPLRVPCSTSTTRSAETPWLSKR